MEAFSSLGGPDLSGLWIFLKILSALLSIGFVAGSIYSWIGIQEVDKVKEAQREEFFRLVLKDSSSPHKKRWKNIVELFQSPDPNAWRIAILDANSMLEELISDMGFMGDSFGEKLKSMGEARISWVDTAWEVHLLRNKLAHEGSRYHLSEREAYRAFKMYENIFNATGYLA